MGCNSTMKIMSFNIQHCRNFVTGTIDFCSVSNAIKAVNPDIVGLNEVRGKGADSGYENQTEILSALTDMKYYYFAKALDVKGVNPYGNAILSKIPIVSAETIPIPNPIPKPEYNYYEPRCVLKAVLGNGLICLITHFGLNPDEQENAVATVLSHLENKKCILMGDFNVSPNDCVLTPITNLMKDASGLFKTPLFSFPSDNPNVKIDYIFASPDIEIINADIPAIIASDHRPHTATINI